VIIVAAGSSTRTDSDELKQFRWVGGKPMLLHSLQTFQERPDVAMVVVVLPKKYAGDPPPWLFQCDVERMLVSVGGRERSDSVRNGLEDLASEAKIVAVHDAARPFVTPALIDRVITEARKGHGAIPGLPVVDTLKRAEVGAGVRAASTEARDGLWCAQTPQMFRYAILNHALRRADVAQLLDEAQAVEALGVKPRLVQGSPANTKVIYPEDVALAEAILAGWARTA
jgi:2-C-methyl-D-erythritol 4-phosphate cytidylyltransferase